MSDMTRNCRKFALKTMAVCAAAAALWSSPADIRAVDMELPSATEVQYFSPEAQQFYAAGVAALDKADYENGYALMSKAAALQPAAIQLNHITATLATYHGRQKSAEEARDYYETAINSLENILRIGTISGELRRQITNELKLAQMERDNLAQRDVMREATGTAFFLDWNRKYAERPDRTAGAPAPAAPATTITLTATPAAGFPAVPGAFPGAMPGQPGMFPGQPGMPGMQPGMPGMQPGMPGMQPGMPGMQPGMQPGAGAPPLI